LKANVNMSSLVERAIEEAGLGPIAEARRQGDLERVRALSSSLAGAGLLALGALADVVRAAEVGEVVRIHVHGSPRDGASAGDAILVGGGTGGADTLRRVATARITGPIAARVRVDWSETGLEIAQVALGFGASELAGPIADRRGLPIALDLKKRVKGAGLVAVQLLKRQELEALIARAGRTVIFADAAPGDRQFSEEAPRAR
jgi:hypothetical protein